MPQPFLVTVSTATFVRIAAFAVHGVEGPGWYSYDAPSVLVISPRPLGDENDPGAAERSKDGNTKIVLLPPLYAAIVEKTSEHFFDAASVVQKSVLGADWINLLVSGNQALVSLRTR
jgi:hypothetical protein